MAKKSKRFYAVKIGKKPGIYTTWSEAESMVKGFKKAIFKGFVYHEDAVAFMKREVKPAKPKKSKKRAKVKVESVLPKAPIVGRAWLLPSYDKRINGYWNPDYD